MFSKGSHNNIFKRNSLQSRMLLILYNNIIFMHVYTYFLLKAKSNHPSYLIPNNTTTTTCILIGFWMNFFCAFVQYEFHTTIHTGAEAGTLKVLNYILYKTLYRLVMCAHECAHIHVHTQKSVFCSVLFCFVYVCVCLC